jgi:lysophospholipase L1-like esterase
MRVLFLGDSITYGVPGAPYLKYLQYMLPGYDLINGGKGGDTVIGLLKRVPFYVNKFSPDLAVVSIGINDIFVKLSKQFAVINKFFNRKYTQGPAQFEKYYEKTIITLNSSGKKVLCNSLTLIGEDIKNPFNREVSQLNKIIAKLCNKYENTCYVDIRKRFINQLKGKDISDYLPVNGADIIIDSLFNRDPEKVNAKSKSRGLHLTIDGVHLNSEGAGLYAEELYKYMV